MIARAAVRFERTGEVHFGSFAVDAQGRLTEHTEARIKDRFNPRHGSPMIFHNLESDVEQHGVWRKGRFHVMSSQFNAFGPDYSRGDF